jgi:GTP pyrophosphokinase
VLGYFADADTALIKKANDYADRVHGDQKRQSGEPYMMHPRAVAKILVDLRLDIPSIVTALLHDTVEDTHATLEDIEKEFGSVIAGLVDGVTKLSKITFKTSEEKQAENFRKMIIAMAKDIRVILVKLGDRLHNMRTLEHLLPYKQKAIAQETLDIYAPIANRLGISSIKTELEDLCLRYLHPDIYYKLANKVAKTRREREKYIEEVTAMIQDKLKEYDLHGVVTGRPKHFFSIYKKMERRNIDYEQVHDVIAFRIILDNITECYKGLGVIHATYKPVPGRFKDYIAIPKANKYQSLHSTVIGPHGERIEIQIRTHEMNQVAEHGIAAHWRYKEGKFGPGSENVEWVNRLLEWHKDLKDPTEFLETVKIDLFAEDVYVFTPKGDVKEFPHGSSPLDFAYSVHTDVGNHCVGAKVNGKIVPLKYKLKSGDTVEILTSPTQAPSKDWIKLVKTSKAKAKIRLYIKSQERARAMQLGKEMLEKEFRSYGQNIAKAQKSDAFADYLRKRGVKTLDDLAIYVGYGRLAPSTVASQTLPADVLAKKTDQAAAEEPSLIKRLFQSVSRKSGEAGSAIMVENLDDILIRFGRCCNPIPGDPIVGFVTRGRGVTVHTTSCPKSLESENERRIDVKWNLQVPVRRHVKIRVLSHDMPGILANMSQAISGCGVNISQANIRTTKDRKAISMFEVEVTNTEQLARVLAALESRKGVINVERVRV